MLEHTAERRGNLTRRQRARRHLVEQRLEQVEVAPVDERHLHRWVAEFLGGRQAAEAAADDHDAVMHTGSEVRGRGCPSVRSADRAAL